MIRESQNDLCITEDFGIGLEASPASMVSRTDTCYLLTAVSIWVDQPPPSDQRLITDTRKTERSK